MVAAPTSATRDARRLAVLGADGFIGSAVVRAALEAELDVTAITVKAPWRLGDLSSPNLERLAVAEGRWWLPEQDPAVAKALAKAGSIALLAYTPPPADEKGRLAHEREVNVRGARAVAEIAEDAGASLVFTSSADVYGLWRPYPLSESAKPEPTRPYSVAKLEAEGEVQRACGAATCLRISTVFGRGENGPRAIPSFIRALAQGDEPVVHGDGSDVRDYVHVDDVAAAILAALAPRPGSPVYNVGSGIARTTSSVLQAVAAAMGRPSLARFNAHERPRSRLVLDTSAISRQLGFRPRVSFEDGIRDEVEWLIPYLAGEGRGAADMGSVSVARARRPIGRPVR